MTAVQTHIRRVFDYSHIEPLIFSRDTSFNKFGAQLQEPSIIGFGVARSFANYVAPPRICPNLNFRFIYLHTNFYQNLSRLILYSWFLSSKNLGRMIDNRRIIADLSVSVVWLSGFLPYISEKRSGFKPLIRHSLGMFHLIERMLFVWNYRCILIDTIWSYLLNFLNNRSVLEYSLKAFSLRTFLYRRSSPFLNVERKENE